MAGQRKAYHQNDPMKFTKAKFDKLEFRQDVKGEKYQEKTPYRDHNYPEEVFFWHAYPRGSETKGEWRMGAADLGDEE
jgi:hypothetical protein